MDPERTLARVGGAEVGWWVERETVGYDSTLEFGCGLGAYTRKILTPIKHGIEIFSPYVESARLDPDNEGCEFFLGDMLDFESIAKGPYDVALFIDSLEHMAKEDGLALLLACQRSFKKIAVLVPIGDLPQDPCDNNEYQRHLSTWYASDLESLGFYTPVDRLSCAYAIWNKE